MCLLNVNVIANFYKNYTMNANNVKVFEAPFDRIVATKEEGNTYIEDFYIVVDYRILGSSDENRAKTNIVDQEKPLHVKIRLAKLSPDESKQYFMDLKDATIDIGSENVRIKHACVDYVSYRQVLRVDHLTLADEVGLGNFALKILVKTNNDEKWNIQSITPLRIE